MNSKNKALLAYIVIFLVGGASGFVLNKAVNTGYPSQRFERLQNMRLDPPRPMDAEIPGRIRNFMVDRLDLTEDQIDPFFSAQSEHMDQVMRVSREKRRSELDTLRILYFEFVNEIDDILSAKQIDKLNHFAHPDSVRQRRMNRTRQGRGR